MPPSPSSMEPCIDVAHFSVNGLKTALEREGPSEKQKREIAETLSVGVETAVDIGAK